VASSQQKLTCHVTGYLKHARARPATQVDRYKPACKTALPKQSSPCIEGRAEAYRSNQLDDHRAGKLAPLPQVIVSPSRDPSVEINLFLDAKKVAGPWVRRRRENYWVQEFYMTYIPDAPISGPASS
jgi:hypothetical protein